MQFHHEDWRETAGPNQHASLCRGGIARASAGTVTTLALKNDLKSLRLVSFQVTCGSVVKLQNVHHKVRLHSHDVKYGSGSGQQSVTGTDSQEDVNSHWAIKGAPAGLRFYSASQSDWLAFKNFQVGQGGLICSRSNSRRAQRSQALQSGRTTQVR